MHVPSIDSITDKLFSLPDKVAMPYNQVTEQAGEFFGLLASVAFGQPESLMRDGNNFMARAKTQATATRKGITIHSQALVKFTAGKVGNELRITNIQGLTAELPIRLVPQIKLDWVHLSVDEQGRFVLFSRKFMIPVTIRVTAEGDVSFF